MFSLMGGLVGLVLAALAVVFFLVVGLLIKLATMKFLVAFVLKATLHGIFPHFLGAVLLVMITTLLTGAILAGIAVCSWWP